VSVLRIDPLRDERWEEFLQGHPCASVFHTTGWLRALERTYGYEPVVYTTAAPGEALKNGIPFCRIQSWLTGRRMVSLPFSDHCEPLLDHAEDLQIFLSYLENARQHERWRYFELRPLVLRTVDAAADLRLGAGEEFSFHRLDLRPEADDLFKSFHKSCVQRKIRKAEKEGLTCEEGRSEALLMKFYRLLLLTRRRHQLPPQPLVWFRNLMDCLGEKLSIRVASKDGRPIASIVTLAYKNSLVYKYGCSDEKFHHLGGMVFLFWRAIQDGKRLGAREFDLGRSEPDNAGLIAFKDHWGAAPARLKYLRYPVPQFKTSNESASMLLAKKIFGRMPNSLLTTAGRVLYRHMG
jgi:CelD/BcsL family acetyltransferase involved in cellulose biosynthesis